MIDEILMERRRELWGEGFGITDVLRTQRPVVRVALTEDEAAKEYDCWQQNGTYKKYHPEGHWFTSFLMERSLCPIAYIICILFLKKKRMRIRI